MTGIFSRKQQVQRRRCCKDAAQKKPKRKHLNTSSHAPISDVTAARLHQLSKRARLHVPGRVLTVFLICFPTTASFGGTKQFPFKL